MSDFIHTLFIKHMKYINTTLKWIEQIQSRFTQAHNIKIVIPYNP